MRTAILIAWGIIALAGIAACSGGSPKPVAGGSGTVQPSSTALYSGTARAPSTSASATRSVSPPARSPSASPSAIRSPSPSPTPRPVSTTPVPTAAPVTGGGGTAGFEHGGLLAVGVLCVLAGGAAFTIRRRLNREG